jgi:hypothetical protein
MVSDVPGLRYLLPRFKGNYTVTMKTLQSSCQFDDSDIARYRLKVIEFGGQYCWNAVYDAFGVKRSTYFLWNQKLKKTRGRLSSLVPRYTVVMAFSLIVMMSFGDLAQRYAQFFGLDRFKDRFSNILFTQKASKPADFEEVTEASKVSVPSDRPPSPEKPGSDGSLPPDVHEKIPIPIAEVDEDGNFTGRTIEVSRTYSDNAYKYGLSAAIRFDALWPRAIAGFMANPLLGSGYSTLTKEEVGQFTEAESTDNDYLRALGETGLLGFLSFFGIIATLCFLALKSFKQVADPVLKAFTIAFIAATAGMLINAIYIDVFEASKVALTYWALAGLLMATLTLSTKKTSTK